MPLYEYQCKECGHSFEEIVPYSDREKPTQQECPSCKKIGAIARAMSALNISYQGGKTVMQRAGNTWNELLRKIHKGAGKGSNVHTK